MDHRPLEQLTGEEQLRLLKALAERTLGASFVEQQWNLLEPLIRNRIGHGEPLTPRMPGDATEPKDNYWKGVWQVYHAE